jgi:hypothetical protein
MIKASWTIRVFFLLVLVLVVPACDCVVRFFLLLLFLLVFASGWFVITFVRTAAFPLLLFALDIFFFFVRVEVLFQDPTLMPLLFLEEVDVEAPPLWTLCCFPLLLLLSERVDLRTDTSGDGGEELASSNSAISAIVSSSVAVLASSTCCIASSPWAASSSSSCCC